MTRRSITPFSQFCWADLMTPDVEMARRFYPAVLGWEARDADPTFGGYFMFFHDDLPAAGAMPDVAGGAMPSAWTPYVAVEDAASSLAAVSAHGGSVVSDAMEVGTLGVMGIFVDPSGAGLAFGSPGTSRDSGRLMNRVPLGGSNFTPETSPPRRRSSRRLSGGRRRS